MNAKRAFWRLLGDYERLTSDEAVALREENFSAIADVQSCKAEVSDAMIQLAGEAGINMTGWRFQALIAAETQNLATAKGQLSRMRCERQNIKVAIKRLRELGGAYKCGSQIESAFAAQG